MTVDETHVLVTGGSGVLGQPLVRMLANRPTTCLVHHSQAIPDGPALLAGDLRLPRMGLSQHAYDDLASRVTHVVHSAASTSFAARPEVLYSANTDATARVLEFVSTASAELVHVSTAFVERAETVRETANAGAEADTARGIAAYVASKQAAEQLVVAAGLDATIVRPSLIVGDSDSGVTARFQGVHLITTFLLEGKLAMLPAPPALSVDFVPRDVVAEAVLAALERPRPRSPYWLTAGAQALTLEQLLELTTTFAEEQGWSVTRPRFVAQEAVDRLIRPVFLEHLPRPTRRRFEFLLALLALFDEQPFPSDLPSLLSGKLPDLAAAHLEGLRHWAAHGSLAGGRAAAS